MSELVGIWLEAVQESVMVLGVSRNEQAGLLEHFESKYLVCFKTF